MAKRTATAKPVSMRRRLSRHFAAIGSVIYWHQFVSRSLETAIWAITRESTNTGIMFAQFRGFEDQIVLFSKLARFRFRDKRTTVRIKAMVDELKKANGQRNNLVHGRWLGVQNNRIQVLRQIRGDEFKSRTHHYGADDIDRIGRRLFRLNNKLKRFELFVLSRNR